MYTYWYQFWALFFTKQENLFGRNLLVFLREEGDRRERETFCEFHFLVAFSENVKVYYYPVQCMSGLLLQMSQFSAIFSNMLPRITVENALKQERFRTNILAEIAKWWHIGVSYRIFLVFVCVLGGGEVCGALPQCHARVWDYTSFVVSMRLYQVFWGGGEF